MDFEKTSVDDVLKPTIQVPILATPTWVATNIGNIQPSDIRHISEKCRKLIADWPQGKLDHAGFVEQVHRALGIPSGIRLLNTAQRKRKLFEPIFERAIEVLRQAGRLREFKARASRPAVKNDEVTAFIAEILIAKEQVELLKDFTLAAVLRGRLSADAITWNDDTEVWLDLMRFAREYQRKWPAKSVCETGEGDDALETGVDTAQQADTAEICTIEDVEFSWFQELAWFASLTGAEKPDLVFATDLVERANALLARAKQHSDLNVSAALKVELSFKALLAVVPDADVAEGSFDKAQLSSWFGLANERRFSDEQATEIASIAAKLGALADEWKQQRAVYDAAVREYLAAAVTRRAELDGPMRSGQSRLVEIANGSAALTEQLGAIVVPQGEPVSPFSTEVETVPVEAPEDERSEAQPLKSEPDEPSTMEDVEEQPGMAALVDPIEPPLSDATPELVLQGWNALNELSARGRHALASQLAEALKELYPSSVEDADLDVYKLLALTTAAQEVVDVPPEPVMSCCMALAAHTLDIHWHAGSRERATLLYLLSGLLFPALFMPASTARNAVKRHIRGKFGSAAPLHRLVEHLSEADRFSAMLVPESLSKADQQEFWRKRLATLQETAADWRNNEEIYHGFGNFRPAEIAWTAIMDTNRGFIGKVMRAFAGTGERAAEQLRLAIGILRQNNIDDLIEQSGAPKLAHRLEGRARSNLLHNLSASTAFLERCLRHLQRAPAKSGGSVSSGVDGFTGMLREHLLQAQSFLKLHNAETNVERAALRVARSAIDRLVRMFDEYNPPALDVPLDRWLGRELLLIPSLRFSGGWDPDPNDKQALIEGAIRLAEHEPEPLLEQFDRAFQEHMVAGAHIPTGRIINELETLGMSKAELTLKHTRRDEDVRDLRGELGGLQATARDHINMAIALNVINDVEKRALETRVRGIRVDRLPIMDMKSDDILEQQKGRGSIAADFPAARDTLVGVEQQLDEKFETVRAQLKESVEKLASEGLAKPVAVDRINKLLEAKDIITANEYLRLLRDGEDLPRESRANAPLFDYMNGFLPNLEREFSSNRQKIIDTALAVLKREADPIPGLFELGSMTAAQREDATRMLEAWRDIRTSNDIASAIERLFVGGLSFDVKQVDDLKGAGRSFRYYLSSSRLLVPDGFLVPLFGSEADGNYLVEVLRGQLKTIELFQHMQGDAAKQRATFHLYTSILGYADRVELAHRAHNHGYQSIAVDDALIAYLAFIQGDRLAAFFNVSSAFIRYNPYNEITPLPPEMFYGRAEQRREILARRGGSLVFGGRRLGKSSLLRDVERKEHKPHEDVFVKCIDINDIGQTNEYASRFWQRLASELREAGVSVQPGSISDDDVVDDIRKFLSGKSSRQIILMLDETDVFLLAEEENKYRNVVRLRQLLEGTEGRFKVVMAGLHNVQRTATTPNQSLGHLGTPICIGPFVDKDRNEGLRLVTEPLAALGFEFQSSTLPLRILSQTNYYPALVQLYCRELLNHLLKTNKQDRGGPPFVIVSEDLEAAYKNQTLSEEINKRFRLSLDLDDRYKLITLVITNAAIEQTGFGAVAPPMKPDEVGRLCLGWAPKLFENRTPGAFLALLEELVGLGVLSQQGREGFVLRSPNLVTMLGSKDSISEELLQFESREPLSRDRSTQRRMLDATRGVPSPLTPAQEYRLMEADSSRISIVLASPATGLDNMERALRSIRPDNSVEVMRVRNVDELLRKAAGRGRSSLAETRVALVPNTLAWDMSWVRRANASADELRERNVRIVFVGAASQARILAEQPNLSDEVGLESVELWSESTFRSYLLERERRDCDIPGLRTQVLEAAGYSGEGVYRLVNSLQERGENIDIAAADVKKELGRRPGLLSNFGVSPDLEPIFVSIAGWSPINEGDLKVIVDEEFAGQAPMSLDGLVRYGAWMGSLFQVGSKIFVNPLVRDHLSYHAD
ncbi:hypothetical protein J6524_31030 [Bradyrhizobium sp. WSM 1738]|uniref:hypothetical protein n=1 Tax=Bradyrhizobium hereditatis TaxID=2821405 RepID=UPI001CE250EA|nr:hypothetical protein [Bradyrhizobium hereditatis]MCA6119277.1 hypothetical protein [Bradyrhizobium hereditatis]